MNPIYDQQITLEQALNLQNKIKAGEMPDIEIYYQYYQTDDHHGNLGSYYLDRCYKDNNDAIHLTRNDYAQYIIGNQPVPEGYGYPSKELKQGTYNGLQWAWYNGSCWTIINDSDDSFYIDNDKAMDNWYSIAFPITYLACVEAEAEKPFADSADWKAKYEAQAAELDEIRTRLRRSSDEVSERKEMLGELKLQLQEATASADSKQQTIEATTKVNNELGDCLRAARDYIEKLEQLGNTQTLLERHTKEKEFAQSAYYETLPF
jgi:hypothetical protein